MKIGNQFSEEEEKKSNQSVKMKSELIMAGLEKEKFFPEIPNNSHHITYYELLSLDYTCIH